MLKGKKKALAAQVLLGLMVAGNVYAVDCGVASAEETAEFVVGDGKTPDVSGDNKYNTWWINGECIVGGEGCKISAGDEIENKVVEVQVGGQDATIMKGKKLIGNTVNINGGDAKLAGSWKIFDAADSKGNTVNIISAKNAWEHSIVDAGNGNSMVISKLEKGTDDKTGAEYDSKMTFKAGNIKVAGGVGNLFGINLDASAAGDDGVVEIAVKGVKAQSTLAKKLVISADEFTRSDYDNLGIDKAVGNDGELTGSSVDGANSLGKIIVNGNGVDLTGDDTHKSVDVNGDNFKVGNVISWRGEDIMSVAGNNATMGNITFNGKSSTLNVSGNGAVLGNVSGQGASSVNISGNNVTVGNITTTAATRASSGGEIIISGNNTTTGALTTGSLKIDGNGTLNAGDVSNVDTIIIQSTATGKVFTAASGLSEDKLDVEKSKTNKTTALFSNDYAASYDADSGYIKNTRTQSIREQSKSYVETQMATLAMVASGADLLANAGFTNAAQAVQDAKDSGESGRSMVPYAAANYGSMRQESGSHVDVKGSNFNIGFAKEVKNGSGKLLFGPMFEYGRGNYDSYLDDGTTGSGTAQNYGIGMMARQTNDNGFYYEGSVRYGKVTSDYSSSNVWAGNDVSYDNSAKYWGAHVGVGKLQKLGGDNAIDLYGKLFYTNQGSSSVNINGDTLDFSSVKSKRSRIGFRYIHGTSKVRSVYAGLAWQYEFDGAAYATANGLSTPSPSVKGSSGMLELGVLIAPKASPVSFDLGVSGWTGKQKGYSLNANMCWSF